MKIIKDDSGVIIIKESGLISIIISLSLFVISIVYIGICQVTEKTISGSLLLFLFVIELFFIFISSWRTVTIDKNKKTITDITRGLVIKKSATTNSFKDPIAISIFHDFSDSELERHIVTLQTSSEEFILTTYYGSKSLNKKSEQEARERIALFLGVPLKEESEKQRKESLTTKSHPRILADKQQKELLAHVEPFVKKTSITVKVIVGVVTVLMIWFLINGMVKGDYSTYSCKREDFSVKMSYYTKNNLIKGTIKGITVTAIEAADCTSFSVTEDYFSATCTKKPTQLLLTTPQGEQILPLETLSCGNLSLQN